MFKKVAADALGLSDIGQIVAPANYGQTEADDYILSEEGERIFFVIKSKSDEYCFTNLALIHVDGATAVSKKRLVKRYDYYHKMVQTVLLETAGTMDLDIEIKFQLGDKSFSIDVDKKQLLELKKLYKALLRISHIQQDNVKFMNYANTSIDKAISSIGRASTTATPAEQVRSINQYAFDWLQESFQTYHRKDFGDVFMIFVAPAKAADDEA